MQPPVHIATETRLLQRVEAAENELAHEREKRVAAERRLAQLEHELAQLRRLIFGTKSERFEPAYEPGQMALFETAAPEEAEERQEISYRRKAKKKPVRGALPDHLPREVIVIEPEGDTSGMKKIGEEVTETLDYRPGRLLVIRRVRAKYADPADPERGVMVAPLPARPIEKGIAEAGLLAHILIEKYVDHLPLYRQVQRFKREGVTLASSTLESWTAATAKMLVPLYDRLVEEVLCSGYIQADETPIPVQDRNVKGKTHRGYYWVYHRPRGPCSRGIVVLDYQDSRKGDGPKAFLKDYRGALQSDGYPVYDGFERVMTLFGCWAHVRRYFHQARDNDPERAGHVLTEIGRLYEVERMLRERNAPAEERQNMRQKHALPVLERLKTYLEAERGLPQSPFGKAVAYALERWDKLVRYTGDGRIEIDNNLVENAIRPIALGRKNYLFAGSHDAAQRAAVIYSLLATCKSYDVNPWEWLSDVLARIPTHPHKRIDELLPHRWEKGNM